MSDKRHPSGWRRTRLLVDADLKPGLLLPLDPSSLHYLTNVLRLGDGDEVYAFDGRGGEMRTELVVASKNSARLRVVAPSDYRPADPGRQIHIGQGATARGRLDWAVEKMTEAGVASITALASFGHKHDKFGKVGSRWRRIAQAACTQCGRMTMPAIGETTDLRSWSDWLPEGAARLVMSLEADTRLGGIAAGLDKEQPVAVLIGRASGLTAAEEQAAFELGFKPVLLGDRILRAETVGVVAASVILAASGEC